MIKDKAALLWHAEFHYLKILSLLLVSFALLGCNSGSSSGSSNGDTPTISVTGVVQKGLFTRLEINAFPVDISSGHLAEAIPVKVTGQNYSINLNMNQAVLLQATGDFIHDVNGSTVTLDQPLQTLLSVGDQNIDANINLLSTIVSELTLQKLPSSALPLTELINQQQLLVNEAFGFSSTTRSDQLDYSAITINSDITDPNLQLLLLSGGILNTLYGNSLFDGGFSNIIESFGNAESATDVAPALQNINGLAGAVIYQNILLNSGYAFLPNLSLVDSPVLSCIVNGTCQWQQPGGPSVSVYGGTVYESEGQAKIRVRLSEATTEDVKLHLHTVSGSALEGVDYLPFNKNIMISAGETHADLDLTIVIDALLESTEDMEIVLLSQSDNYQVLNGTAKIFIRDGAPITLNQQDASTMEIRSVEAAFLCTSAGDCGSLNTSLSLGIPHGKHALIGTKIDLATLCSSVSNCSDQTHDWLVEFYLVSKDISGVSHSEITLGSYIYKKESVQIVNQPSATRYPLIAIGGSDVSALVNQATLNSWHVNIEARIGSPAVAATALLPPIINLPTSVLAGETLIPLGTVYSVSDAASANCQQGDLSITAEYILDENVAQTGSLCVVLDQADPWGSPAEVVDGNIQVQSGFFKLPDGVTTRLINQYAGLPSLIPAVLNVFPVYMHAEGWPFEILLDQINLSSKGIEVSYKGMRYIMDTGYSDQDPRKNGQLFSNDIYYRGVAGQTGTLLLNPDGIKGQIGVVQGIGNTAFPKTAIEWQNAVQQINQNHLQPIQISLNNIELTQSTGCNEADCAVDLPQTWKLVADNVKLDGDGFLLGDAKSQKMQSAVFGVKDNGQFSWSRPDDVPLQQYIKLALPGFVIPDSFRVSDYLLAHLDETPISENIARYPLGSDAFTDGNYHPVGLSLGPEIYRNALGIPEQGDGLNLSTQGQQLRLDNGVDSPFNLTSSVAVKYVLRNSGITGVFNVASSSLGLNSAARFYGYPLNLSRFAVRVTDNQLDDYTWIDGQLALKGDAGGADGLDIYFSNLQINCSARLGKVNLLYERCDGVDNNANNVIDENCLPIMHSWKAKTDIFAAGFSSSSNAESCTTGAQYFSLDQQFYFSALNDPVAFRTQWSPAGDLLSQTSGELPQYRFDHSEQGEGFPVKTNGAKLSVGDIEDERYGWLELVNTKVGVTFWDALAADLRVANRQQFSKVIAEPTVVIPENQLANLQGITAETNKQLLQKAFSNKVDLNAHYQWGNTGFGFNLPVYFQPYQLDPGNTDVDAQGRQSRFVGRTLSYDLFVLDANAGINFIEPQRTKLSFGASADFERLGNISFQIDPVDSGSAAAVDDLLMSLSITNAPLLEPALSDFLTTLNLINRYGNRGLNEVVKEGLVLSLKEIGQAAASLTSSNQDPFITASEILASVRSGPQQAISLIADNIRTPLDNRLFSFENQLRNEIANLRNAISTMPLQQVLIKAGQVSAILDQIIVTAESIDDNIDETIALAQGLLTQAHSRLNDLIDVTYDIDQVLSQSVNFVESSCSNGFILNTEGNGYLDPIAKRFAGVRKLVNTVNNSNTLFSVAETLAKDTEQKRRLNASKRRIREAATELSGFVNSADKAVRDVVCDAGDIAQVTSKAFQLTEKIRQHAGIAEAALIEALIPVNELLAIKQILLHSFLTPVRELSAALNLARIQLVSGDIPVTELLNKADCILLELNSNGSYTCQAPPVEFGISVTMDQVFNGARQSINHVISELETELIAVLDNALPGAFMSPQQIREMLAAEIMRSEPIKDMQLKMDKYFGEISTVLNSIVLQYFDQLNLVIQSALNEVVGPVNKALSSATAIVREMPLKAASIDGYATIAGNELERAHIGAAWTMRGSDDTSDTGFRAALDAESWSARHIADELNTPTACAAADSSSLLDVKISALGMPIDILATQIELEKIYLGFTLKQNSGSGPALIPIGIFGGINTVGRIGFTDAVIINPAFAAGLGQLQSYIGASAAANFSDLEAEVAFLVGRVCPGNSALSDLDPDVAKFLPSMPASGFTGAYLRGGASIPLIPGGCFLNLGVSADFGSWVFTGPPATIGGMVGGGASGEVLCIASIKGKVRVAGSVNTEADLKLVGEAWGVAGAGFDCDKSTWTSVRRSRDDDWCGTGDIETSAIFENGKWNIKVPTPQGIF